MKARFSASERDPERNIVFLEDLANHYGSRTITNDAEAVYAHWADVFGDNVRIVYRDTDGEWWEIVANDHPWQGKEISFRPWYGAVWDRLLRVE